MEDINENKNREKWVDDLKAYTCILVVIGHLLQGLNTAEISWNNTLYRYVNTYLYLFHMPLFMFLSGYLYKKTAIITNAKEYIKFIKKKVINLGIPFVTFYLVYIFLKMIFSDEVNSRWGLSEIYNILIKPIAPFWFLYCLIIIFIIIPLLELLIKNKKIILLLLFLLKLIACLNILNVYAIQVFGENGLYFYLGAINLNYIKKIQNINLKKYAKPLFITFMIYILSTIYYYNCTLKYKINFEYVKILFAIIAIIMHIFIINYIEKISKKRSLINMIYKYSFQIYLLHTIFSANIRIILLKLGSRNFYIHFLLGLFFGIFGSIIVAKIFEKSVYLNVFFFPINTYKKIKQKNIE